jgi:hypothetical protein
MNANDPNVALLEVVAERLGDDLRMGALPSHLPGDAASQEHFRASSQAPRDCRTRDLLSGQINIKEN